MKTVFNLSTFASITHDTTEIWVQLSNITTFNGYNLVALKNAFPQIGDIAKISFIIRANGNHDVNITNVNNQTTPLTFVGFKAYAYSNILEFKDVTIEYRNTEAQTVLANVIYQTEKTPLMLYRLKCKRNKVRKIIGTDIIEVGTIYGEFNNVVSLKNPTIDVEGFNLTATYNYVFIVSLNRYYFIQNVDLVTDKVTRLSLSEDVLNSHEYLIRFQKAFVSRYENVTVGELLTRRLIDNRRPVEDAPTVTIESMTPVTTGSLVNITFETDFIKSGERSKPHILVATNFYLGNPSSYLGTSDAESIDEAFLPEVSPHYSNQQHYYFMDETALSRLIFLLMRDSATASFLAGVVWLPFDPTTAFNLPAYHFESEGTWHTHTNDFYISDKQWNDDYTPSFVPNTQTGTVEPKVIAEDVNYKPIQVCKYLVAFDGSYVSNLSWQDYEPNSMYEINVPFYGLVPISAYELLNQHLLIYYTMDLKSGMATAYIYNKDRHYVVWSAPCQLGARIEVTSSNYEENLKTKQSADLNMAIGLLASGYSFYGSVASEDVGGVVNSLMGATKTIVNNVNTKRMLMTRGHTVTGSNEGNLYTPLDVFVKKTTHVALSTSDATFKEMEGLPYNDYVTDLASLSGYTEIGEIQFDAKGYDIYNEEINEIVTLLHNGVIL